MFGRRRLERFETRQEAVLEQVGHITAALIAREPGTALSVNAYEGLRKQVSIAARDRRQHLARLVEMMDAIDRGATTETLRRKCEQWCHEAGLEAVSDLARAEAHWFRIVEGDGPELEVATPAWVDTEVGHLIHRGTARRLWPAPVEGSDAAPVGGEPGAQPAEEPEPAVPESAEPEPAPADLASAEPEVAELESAEPEPAAVSAEEGPGGVATEAAGTPPAEATVPAGPGETDDDGAPVATSPAGDAEEPDGTARSGQAEGDAGAERPEVAAAAGDGRERDGDRRGDGDAENQATGSTT